MYRGRALFASGGLSLGVSKLSFCPFDYGTPDGYRFFLRAGSVANIDVYPGTAPDNDPNPRGVRMGGFQMLLAGEVFRGKYRNSFSKPEPFVPGRPTKIEFDLRDRYHRFLKGHKIMVQVQSSWFPVIDRNPQKFMDIYQAKASDFQKATHRVFRTSEMPSHVKVGVLKE